jgi:HAD superfamily hydrolase (TIGR01549 family)
MGMKKPLKAVVFDFDGTIINSIESTMVSFNYAIEKVDVGPFTSEEIKKYFGAGADRILKQLIGDNKKSLEAFAVFKEHQRANAHTMILHAGIISLLEMFHQINIPMGIVTGRHSDDLEILLAPHQLHHFFKFLICDNHVSQSKPHPEGLFLAAKKLGIHPDEMIYIGDSLGDIEAAQAAGAISIAATWDQLVTREHFKSASPTYWAQKPEEVWSIFQALQ